MTNSISRAPADACAITWGTEPLSLIDASWTTNDTIRRFPATLAAFARHGLETCCGGTKTLAEEAETHRLDLGALMSALNAEIDT